MSISSSNVHEKFFGTFSRLGKASATFEGSFGDVPDLKPPHDHSHHKFDACGSAGATGRSMQLIRLAKQRRRPGSRHMNAHRIRLMRI